MYIFLLSTFAKLCILPGKGLKRCGSQDESRWGMKLASTGACPLFDLDKKRELSLEDAREPPEIVLCHVYPVISFVFPKISSNIKHEKLRRGNKRMFSSFFVGYLFIFASSFSITVGLVPFPFKRLGSVKNDYYLHVGVSPENIRNETPRCSLDSQSCRS